MISIKNLTKIYPNSNKTALNKFTLDIQENESIGLLGPNGAGKTTLIKCLTGLVIPNEGEILINNKNLNYKNNKSINDIAVVLEGARNLYWRVSVKSNFYYFGALKGITKKEIDYRLNKYINLFNIDDLIDKKVNQLSLGQKQKVALLSCILLEKKILILDEPSNGLDIEAKEDLLELLISLKKNLNTTLIIASHDIDFIISIIDKFIIINDGEIRDIIINNELSSNLIKEKYMNILS